MKEGHSSEVNFQETSFLFAASWKIVELLEQSFLSFCVFLKIFLTRFLFSLITFHIDRFHPRLVASWLSKLQPYRLKCHFKCHRLFASLIMINKYYVSRKKSAWRVLLKLESQVLSCFIGMRQGMQHLEIIFSSSCKYILGLEGKFNGTRRDERFIKVLNKV